MFKVTLTAIAATLALVAGTCAADEFGNGNMHFDSNAIAKDSNGMITKEAMMAYGEAMWRLMSKGVDPYPDQDAETAFARGNLQFSATDMDTDHDGTISKAEFMAYAGKRFEKAQHGRKVISGADANTYFARGNMH